MRSAAAARPKPAAYLFRDELKAALAAARQRVPYNYKDLFKVLVALVYYCQPHALSLGVWAVAMLDFFQSATR